jgi:vancomycin resistance protein YoaR
MPKQRGYRIFILVAALIFCLIIAVQLAYPADRGLPMASLPGRSLALANHETMAKAIIDQFDALKLKLTIGPEKTIESPLKSAGAEPNTEETIDKLSDYPFWQRLIPGSIFRPSAHVSEASVYYTTKQLQTFADTKSKELSFAPQNARLAIRNGQLVAADALAGSHVASSDTLRAINEATIVFDETTVVRVPATRAPAARSAKDLAQVRTQAEVVLAHLIIIKAGDQQFSPTKTDIASWVVLSTDSTGNVTLLIDKNKIRTYLDELNKKVGIPAGQTNITLVDGREAGRTTGAIGHMIDEEVVTNQLATALLVPPKAVSLAAPFIDVQPSVIFNSKYSTTQAGLQAYVDDTARTKNMHIVIRQLDGEHWSVRARETESIPSASTYKLFIALVLFDKIDKGEIHWDDPMLDTTVAGCFERMTVASTNPCAEKWIAEFGRQYINDFIYARGFSTGTTFISDLATQTTAADLTKFMIGLNDGTLVSGTNRARLLDSLGRHPYQYGIPTGSAGTVHDKVGFLWDYVHDTAIVQHPRGTYIMTIMSKGQSYAAIAAVTRDVERIMYP